MFAFRSILVRFRGNDLFRRGTQILHNNVRMSLQCFLSIAALALNATLLYDDNSDDGNLWKRDQRQVPPPFCSSSLPPPDSRCLVCIKDEGNVFAVCNNLKEGVKMILEGDGKFDPDISEKPCPQLRSDGARTAHLSMTNTLGIFLLAVAVMIWAAQ